MQNQNTWSQPDKVTPCSGAINFKLKYIKSFCCGGFSRSGNSRSLIIYSFFTDKDIIASIKIHSGLHLFIH